MAADPVGVECGKGVVASDFAAGRINDLVTALLQTLFRLTTNTTVRPAAAAPSASTVGSLLVHFGNREVKVHPLRSSGDRLRSGRIDAFADGRLVGGALHGSWARTAARAHANQRLTVTTA